MRIDYCTISPRGHRSEHSIRTIYYSAIFAPSYFGSPYKRVVMRFGDKYPVTERVEIPIPKWLVWWSRMFGTKYRKGMPHYQNYLKGIGYEQRK